MIDSAAGMDTRVRSVMMCGGARAQSGEGRGQRQDHVIRDCAGWRV